MYTGNAFDHYICEILHHNIHKDETGYSFSREYVCVLVKSQLIFKASLGWATFDIDYIIDYTKYKGADTVCINKNT